MKVKAISDIDTALRIFYQYSEIGTAQIKELFGVERGTANKYKKAALEAQISEGIKTMSAHTVNTEIAYATWGIDVEDLEKRRTKLKRLGLN